eukprot:364355-Chlamydomonas_euryale.AAC.4
MPAAAASGGTGAAPALAWRRRRRCLGPRAPGGRPPSAPTARGRRPALDCSVPRRAQSQTPAGRGCGVCGG